MDTKAAPSHATTPAGSAGEALEPGWDSVDRMSLRFRDRRLESQYEAHIVETRRRRQRAATRGGAAMFLTLALIAPPLTGLGLWPVTGILLLLTGTNLAAAFLARIARTTRQLDAVGIGIQLSSGALLLLLFVAIDLFERFAAVTLTAQSIFAFGVSRHPFRNAATISAGHTFNFIIFGVATGLAPGILVDAFILGAAVAGASAGTYAAERGERRLFAQSLVVERLHRHVDELLHRYLPPQVADSLIADPTRAELGGEEVEVTVLFADLTGFTAFSERVRPEEAVAMLNTVFGAAVPVVVNEGGTVVQFAGDAMMVIFNAPIRQADHAARAARAALGLQVATAALRRVHDGPRFRVGINTGFALVGNVGSRELRSFTAIGDTTNLAARLQTFAPSGSIVIGQRTREMLGDLAEVRPLGEPELKGKSVPVKVYELLGLRDVQNHPQTA